jgi:hypothetical protein
MINTVKLIKKWSEREMDGKKNSRQQTDGNKINLIFLWDKYILYNAKRV